MTLLNINSSSNFQTSRSRRATSFMFLVCGLAYSAWAPMVPYLKADLELSESILGIILLAFGIGALITMPASGWAVHRYGSRKVTSIAAPSMIGLLPFLATASSPLMLTLLLFLFGAAGGAFNVSVNSQAAAVQAQIGRPITSTFHCLFSLGGLLGAGSMTLLLMGGFTLTTSTLSLFFLMLGLSLWHCRSLLPKEADVKAADSPVFSLPNRQVLFFGIVCFILFLAEGSMLDWGAIFLRSAYEYDAAIAGLGYAIFSVAMAMGRFFGDKLIVRFGPIFMVRMGGILASTGIFLMVATDVSPLELFGFFLIGLGASNIVPIVFSSAGNLPNISAGIALTMVITMGYTGMLLGPAFIGWVAELTTLSFALSGIAILLLGVGLSANKIAIAQASPFSDSA